MKTFIIVLDNHRDTFMVIKAVSRQRAIEIATKDNNQKTVEARFIHAVYEIKDTNKEGLILID